jgi:hypothetical protein
MTTALEGGEESASRPDRSLPTGKTRYLLYRRLGGPQGRSGQMRNISSKTGFDLRTVQPIARRYTVYATRPSLKLSTLSILLLFATRIFGHCLCQNMCLQIHCVWNKKTFLKISMEEDDLLGCKLWLGYYKLKGLKHCTCSTHFILQDKYGYS